MDHSFPVDDRNRVRRRAQRGHYDRASVYAILDEGPICHVAYQIDGQPFAIPTIHARIDDALYFHGSPANRMLGALAEGAPACVTVTLIDALVLARSAFHHSMNYRSAVVFGNASAVEDDQEKLRALSALVERLVPGRWKDTRHPTPEEIRATVVVRLPIEQASAKIRTGDPVDDESDHGLPHWAGVVPITRSLDAPHSAADLRAGIEVPQYLRDFASDYGGPAQ